MIVNLQQRLEAYNMEQGETCVRMEETTDGQTIIAVCTPLMKRVHRLGKHSGELMFMDSSGLKDTKLIDNEGSGHLKTCMAK